jgi:hypothetical protein
MIFPDPGSKFDIRDVTGSDPIHNLSVSRNLIVTRPIDMHQYFKAFLGRRVPKAVYNV